MPSRVSDAGVQPVQPNPSDAAQLEASTIGSFACAFICHRGGALIQEGSAMALKAAMWVHGTIVEPEYPPLYAVRRGWGTHFGGAHGTTNWFHIPITTPVILDGVRPRLVKVFVFFHGSGGYINQLHVYDGRSLVKTLTDLRGGDHSGWIEPENTWEITPPLEIRLGLGICVSVSFITNPQNPGEILFTTAGADFEVP
jgi:hypothetical protein